MRRTLRKASNALSINNIQKAVRNPDKILNFVDNLRASFRVDRMDIGVEQKELPKRLSEVFDEKEKVIREYQKEIENNSAFYNQYDKKIRNLKDENLFKGTTSTLDAQTMYVVCRLIEPDVVIETGVRYGSFDAHITAALNKNDNGVMYGIDLPNSIEKFDYGYLIPDDCRSRWNLRLGDSNDILPELLEDEGPVDMFLHDSLHTREHMNWEYETAYPRISDGGILASHDVLKSNVFGQFADNRSMNWTRVYGSGVAQK